jgi:hypothetical protein
MLSSEEEMEGSADYSPVLKPSILSVSLKVNATVFKALGRCPYTLLYVMFCMEGL